ncbi:MAG: site-specific integrase [Planctomycetia bacterium]|nr:site-specific integrase [Planctomycetia bacterium]
MRVFRTKYKNRDGQSKEAAKWYLEFRDGDEQVRRLPGFTDKQQTETLGRKVEKLIECKQNRETPGRELSAWLETLPRRMRETLAAWGIIEGRTAAASKPLVEHLKDFEAALTAKGSGLRHVEQSVGRVRRLFEACGFVHWSNVTASNVVAKLAEWRQPTDKGAGLSIQTTNYHTQAAKQFCRWMVREGRAIQSPIEHVQRQNAKTDRRLERRALSVDELRRLLAAATKGAERHGMTGSARAMLYRLAVETGLRSSELRSLTRASFDFRTEPATVMVAAGYSKRRREDTLPLRPETATVLQAHVGVMLPAVRIFDLPRREEVAEMLRADLTDARAAWLKEVETDPRLLAEREQSDFLKYSDDAGHVADFHALRHTFISNLARGGVHPKLAQALARHSTITLTMDRYSHTVLGEQSDALVALPDLSEPVGQQQQATGTDGRNVTTAGNSGPQNVEAPRLAFCLAFSDSEHRPGVQSDAVDQARESRDEKRAGAREKRENRDDLRRENLARPTGLEPATTGSTVRWTILRSLSRARTYKPVRPALAQPLAQARRISNRFPLSGSA